jgi:hypothetical protein
LIGLITTLGLAGDLTALVTLATTTGFWAFAGLDLTTSLAALTGLARATACFVVLASTSFFSVFTALVLDASFTEALRRPPDLEVTPFLVVLAELTAVA